MQIANYSNKEPKIFVWVMAPYTLLMNLILFGSCAFSSLPGFLITFFVSLFYFAIIYLVFGLAAILVKKRFSEDSELFKRIAVLLPLFCVMNVLSVQGIYEVYERINLQSCPVRRDMQWWMTGFGCLVSAFITFINEAASGWEKWKASVTETARLQGAYQKTRLLSLQRQVNPHFLFNCFNTLSSLIEEDEAEADVFLNEMTKVYRYLLKSDAEPLVSLAEEIKFAEAYLYLTTIRFGDAVQASIEVDDDELLKQIAPLSLQAILENIIYRNAFSKTAPLYIRIYTNEINELVIDNTMQPKAAVDAKDYDEMLDDLVSKYKLLCGQPVRIHETMAQRQVHVPLIEKTEGVV